MKFSSVSAARVAAALLFAAVAAAAAVVGTAVAVAPFGPSPAGAAEPTPLEVFQRFIHDNDPHVRRKAVSALADQRGAAVINALLAASRDEDAGVRDRAAAILVDRRDRSDEIAALVAALGPKSPAETRALVVRALAKTGAAGVEALRAALKDRDAAVCCAAARGLAELRDVASSPDLHAMLTRDDAIVRAVACDAIGELVGAAAVGTACGVALGDHAVEPRVAAMAILARHPAPEGLDAALRCVDDAGWSLRVAAARAVASFGGDPESARRGAEALVRSLGRESRERVRVEYAEALWSLTGIDFGPDRERWARWWKETGGRFDPPAKRPVRAARAPGSTQGGLADLPLESEHVVFVFDASTSMSDPVRFGVKTTKREDLETAFQSVLARLPKPSWLNLIPFATTPVPMRPALVEATPQVRSATLRHLQKTPAEGRTNIYDALELAISDPEADTVVLLTDGAPSAGKRTGRNAILDGVRDMNRYRLARIHTIEIGAANTGARWKGFLLDIADATGGRHLSR